mmetsp:Transcript_58702/g.127473  ORF Transcript_58702/g.127473 Transcript_58702/m.127473 type:complete len:144 (-) Transcript_58702:953-1384(-)
MEKDVNNREKEIKLNDGIISSKQLDLNKLNKEYMKLLERNKGSEEVGELNVKLHYLKKKLEEQEEKNKNLNNEWMKNQTNLIQLQETKSEENETLKEIKNKELVLENKKRRVETSVESQNKEIKELRHKLKALQNDLNRLNDA